VIDKEENYIFEVLLEVDENRAVLNKIANHGNLKR